MDYSTSYRKPSRGKNSYRRNSAIKRQRLSSRVDGGSFPEPPPPSHSRPSSHVAHEYGIPEETRPSGRYYSHSQAMPGPSYASFGASPVRPDEARPEDRDEDLPPQVHDTRRRFRYRDLLLRSQEPMDTRTPEVRGYMTICVYQKRFDSCSVPLKKSRSGSGGKSRSLGSDPRSDQNFFRDLQYHYREELIGRWRRLFRFKTVSTVRLLQVCLAFSDILT
ncbi:hypothetical protein BDV97DRAFT_353788 [Delphinella strobiligena]|nr:hypothetical protein BDV97DRAFT_353788 [Delphinella strobiligena]